MPNLFRFQLTLIVQIKQITPQQVNIPWNANVIFVNVKAQTVLSSYWTCTTMTYQWRWIGHYGQWLMRGDRTGQWYPDCLLVLFAAIIRRLPGFICRNHCQRRRIASCPLALPTSCLPCLCLSILLPVSNFHFFEPNLQIVRVMKSVRVCPGVYVCARVMCVCVVYVYVCCVCVCITGDKNCDSVKSQSSQESISAHIHWSFRYVLKGGDVPKI